MAVAMAANGANTLVVKEDRKTIDKFREWYKEEVIDTGKSQQFERMISKSFDLFPKVVEMAGKAVTVVLTLVPADGSLGETLAILASPFLTRFAKAFAKEQKRNVLLAKRKFEAKFIGADGSCEDVEIPEAAINNLGIIVEDVKGIVNVVLDSESRKGASR